MARTQSTGPTTPITSLLLAGATGLVGQQALQQALATLALRAVHALVRKPPPSDGSAGPAGERLLWHVVDYGRLQLPRLQPAADAALCALGTTIKAAGSQAAFRAVDHDAVLAFARAAQAAGVQRLAVVSALGADAASTVFYNRVKGETEAALQALGLQRLVLARPSLLVGDRAALGQPVRAGERLGLALSRPLSSLIPLRWRPVDAAVVARALLRALAQDGPAVQVLESDDLQRRGQP